MTSTLKTARIIFFGIAAQATLFVFWGAQFFLMPETPQTGGWSVYVVFSLMALISFVYGIRFFQNYTKVKSAELSVMGDKKKKETLLLVTAIHLLLLEFVCVLGILLSLFVQRQWVIYPFYAVFLAGLWWSYPRPEWYQKFYGKTDGDTNL